MKLIIALFFSAGVFAQCPEFEAPEKEIEYKDQKWELIHHETLEKDGICGIRKVYENTTDNTKTIEIICRLEKS